MAESGSASIKPSGSASIKPIDIRADDENLYMEEEEEVVFTPETLEAIEEAERIARDPNVKGYRDIDELMKDLLADD